MLYFSKLRILSIALFSSLFILIALTNLFKIDDDFFDKKINLGLDLQGGSYLLLEIDNAPCMEQKLQNLTTTIRNYFKEQNIKINNIKIELRLLEIISKIKISRLIILKLKMKKYSSMLMIKVNK